MRMKDDEDIQAYLDKLTEVSNEFAMLGEPITNKALVSKVLRSLPPRFEMKVCVVEEGHDVSTLDFTKLGNILKNHELKTNAKTAETNTKSVALRSTYESDDESYSLDDLDIHTNKSLLVQRARKLFKRIHKLLPRDSSDSSPPRKPYKDPSYKKNSEKPPNTDPKKFENVQCHACSGWGHYANKCANTQRKSGTAMWVALNSEGERENCDDLSDTEDFLSLCALLCIDKDNVEETSKSTPPKVYCFRGSVDGHVASEGEEDISYVEAIEQLRKLYENLIILCNKQDDMIDELRQKKRTMSKVIDSLEVCVSRREKEQFKMSDRLDRAEGTLSKYGNASKNLSSRCLTDLLVSSVLLLFERLFLGAILTMETT